MRNVQSAIHDTIQYKQEALQNTAIKATVLSNKRKTIERKVSNETVDH